MVTTLLLKKQPKGDCSFAPTAISRGSAKPSRRCGCDHPGRAGMMLTISGIVRVPSLLMASVIISASVSMGDDLMTKTTTFQYVWMLIRVSQIGLL